MNQSIFGYFDLSIDRLSVKNSYNYHNLYNFYEKCTNQLKLKNQYIYIWKYYIFIGGLHISQYGTSESVNDSSLFSITAGAQNTSCLG